MQHEKEMTDAKQPWHRRPLSDRLPQIIQKRASHSEHDLDLHLTKREIEVLCLVAQGYTDRQVAQALLISHRTVNRHLSNIFSKLNVSGRTAAVASAFRQGLVG